MSGPSIDRANSRQDWGTPDDLIAAVEQRFGPIAFDLAASATNSRAPRYFDEMEDSLKQDWHLLGGVLWLNPPYSHIAPWAKKCQAESALGAHILFLVPASVGSNWFRDYVFKQSRVLFLNNRIHFVGSKDPYPKDCMIVEFGRGADFEMWRWK